MSDKKIPQTPSTGRKPLHEDKGLPPAKRPMPMPDVKPPKK